MNKNEHYRKILRRTLGFYIFLVLMVSIVFALFFTNTYYDNVNDSLIDFERKMINVEKKKTKQKIDKLIVQLKTYQKLLYEDKNTKEEIDKILLKFIKSFSFNRNDYIFVFDSKGNQLVHVESKYEGQNRIDLKDPNGVYIIQGLIEVAKELKGGFFEYTATTGKRGFSKDKISYANYIKENDWVIGSGVYLDNLSQTIKIQKNHLKEKLVNQIVDYIKYSLIFVVLFLMIGYYLYKHIENLLGYYREIIQAKNIKLKELNKVITSKVVEVKEDNRKKDLLLFQKVKLAFMGELLNNIAHQWRQPLNEIMSYASISSFSLKNNKISNEELQNNLHGIVSSTTYLSQTIEDFRTFFSTNAEKEFKSIEKIFEQAFNLFSPISKKEGIKIIFENNIKDIFILSSFLQVLLNLLNNSKDALLEKKIENKIIYIKLNIIDSTIVISYTDNAGGIPEEVQDRIFEPYFSTKSDSQGIGLYMTYQILTVHMKAKINVANQRFEVENKQYVGACFDIKIKEFYE